jgi:multidrug efflux pump
MNISAPFIARPVATMLLTLGLALAGILAYFSLPVAPLPQVDFPTIAVTANLPGASPQTMAATVAAPLERVLGSIAGVNEITSRSFLGTTSITLQFSLNRDIHGAAADVQAAINAARALLPSNMPSSPSYRKVNPADAPIVVIALTSAVLTRGQMTDAASTVLAQRLAQVAGVGQVTVGGGALPAVRVQLDPYKLAARGIAIDSVRTALMAANPHSPKGYIDDGARTWQISARDQISTAEDFSQVVIGMKNSAPVHIKDVATVLDSVQDIRNFGLSGGKPSVVLLVRKEPGANTLETAQRVRALLPRLQSALPAAMDVNIIADRTHTIAASLHEVQRALSLAVGLVVLVVLLFLRNARVALVPAVAVPVSLAGTLCAMYLCGFSLNNLSAMALTVATGFMVDDAIVVLENISRHIERGLTPRAAALQGAREVGFTVVAMTLSLVAVFIPLLFMQGMVGRLFREFSVVLMAACLVSMVVSLTTTPMMAAHLLRKKNLVPKPSNGFLPLSHLWGRGQLSRAYRRSLAWTLRHQPVALLALLGAVALNIYLYSVIPKNFFPLQDTGTIQANLQADQSSSFALMQTHFEKITATIAQDPAVANVSGSVGGNQRNTANFFINLKPLAQRDATVFQVISRLRPQLAYLPGLKVYLDPVQDIRIGARQANAAYQYTVQADQLSALRTWAPKVRQAIANLPELQDVNTDQQDAAQQITLEIDRDAAARLGVNISTISSLLDSAFSQRQISVIYRPLNQYRVVMELSSEFLQDASTLQNLYVTSATGAQVPLAAITTVGAAPTPLSVNHQSGAPASTISFNLAPQISLAQAKAAIQAALAPLAIPDSVRGSFEGTASAFAQTLASQPALVLTAIAAIYLLLGMLYESLVHPITILSTLPSAGTGALLALMLYRTEFSVIAFIGVILLIGIVKKNAIMMIDFAIVAQKTKGTSAGSAIFRAAHQRVRPIMMTTCAAILGALPLAIGSGQGFELRQPLGIAIVGGLILSQLLTLYTTPVVFVLMDRLRT